MTIPDDWKKLNLPLGFVVAVGTVLWMSWAFLHSEFVRAQEFQQYKQPTETRSLTRDRSQLETEVLKLQIKKDTYPKKFDAIDKALLSKFSKDLQDVKADLKAVQQQQVPK